MKLYTRGGDLGETALFGGGRVGKHHLRIEASGEIDELNAALGLAIVVLEGTLPDPLIEELRTLQEDLFTIGAHLATPAALTGEGAARHLPALPEQRIAQMEGWIDAAYERLPELRNFILPGGTEPAARLHLARTICRRAERRVVALARESDLSPLILSYLNRLSDWLFTLARLANLEAGRQDVLWRGRS